MENPETYKVRTALLSVSNKDGIVEFGKELQNLGVKIYSTGGTAALLEKNGIEVTKVADLTGFPEIMDGRVKTLHPAVHAGLLADRGNEKHMKRLKRHNMTPIDLLVINLYPFEKTIANPKALHEEVIENIDIGGPAMLRSAAKNYQWCLPLVKPVRYGEVLSFLREKDLTAPRDYRKLLAAEAFSHTAYYDGVISSYFLRENEIALPDTLAIPLNKEQKLRYGENPHQTANLYGSFGRIFSKLHGKDLSYNNIIDIDAAAKLILEFGEDKPACGIIKHTNPCGVAVGDDLSKAYEKAFATDKVSPFGGILVFNKEIDLKTAETIHSIFTEVVIAPSFTKEALELLTQKKNRRLVEIYVELLKKNVNYDIRSVSGGFLMQSADKESLKAEKWEVVTKRAPTEEETAALKFAWKVVKHVKSNAILYAAADRTLAVGAGQPSRLDSAKIAAIKAEEMGIDLKGSVVASDAFFPFPDGMLATVEAGATAIVQPGGSVRDEDVVKAADEKGVAMVFTGARHFRH